MATIILTIPAAWLLTGPGPKITGLIAWGFHGLGASIGGLATNAITLLIGRVIKGMSIKQANCSLI